VSVPAYAWNSTTNELMPLIVVCLGRFVRQQFWRWIPIADPAAVESEFVIQILVFARNFVSNVLVPAASAFRALPLSGRH